MRLKDKVAIVTGGGRGLGRAAAVEMAREGARVAILSRTSRELEATAREIGEDALALTADVSKKEDITRVVEKTAAAFGRVDILMNNAAIVGPVGPTYEVGLDDWEEVLGINLLGVVALCRAVLPYMLRQGSGKIINVTSGLGEMVMPPLGAYSVSKAGLMHLTRIMAAELRGLNIQVNGLDPGVMDTTMQTSVREMGPEVLGAEVYRDLSGMKAGGHLAPPSQAARLAVFLASRESDHINGAIGTEGDYTALGYKPE
jgi:3-oxoacyl-[acyl-carrier protein] reductase